MPNLGVVQAGGDTFTIADVPGLIPGAATGKGLGLEFLRHIERTSVLVHVIDTAVLEADRDPAADIDALEAELAAYGGLEDRPRLIALNKIDVPDGRAMAELARPELEKYGWPIFEISAATREGLREFTYALSQRIKEHDAAKPVVEATRVIVRPIAVDDSGFEIETDGDGVYVVRGPRPERWVKQTNFENEEAVGYLADRLARIGIEDELAKAGAEPGAEVRIGTYEFEWQPTIYAGADFTPGNRGTDYRLDDPDTRPTAAQRLAARKARRIPYEQRMAAAAAARAEAARVDPARLGTEAHIGPDFADSADDNEDFDGIELD